MRHNLRASLRQPPPHLARSGIGTRRHTGFRNMGMAVQNRPHFGRSGIVPPTFIILLMRSTKWKYPSSSYRPMSRARRKRFLAISRMAASISSGRRQYPLNACDASVTISPVGLDPSSSSVPGSKTREPSSPLVLLIWRMFATRLRRQTNCGSSTQALLPYRGNQDSRGFFKSRSSTSPSSRPKMVA